MSNLKLVPDPVETTAEKGKGNETLKLCDYTVTRTYIGTLQLKKDWTGMSAEDIEEAFEEYLWDEHDIHSAEALEAEADYGEAYDACSDHKDENPYSIYCSGFCN